MRYNRIPWICVAVLVAFFLAGTAVYSEEEGEEKKAKPPEKPRPDSAISTVLQLPEVKKWSHWAERMKDGSSLTVWGEAIKTVNDAECWDVAVGINKGLDTKVLARFCVMQVGLDLYVEGKQKDPMDAITYYPYEVWRKSCHPTESTAGRC